MIPLEKHVDNTAYSTLLYYPPIIAFWQRKVKARTLKNKEYALKQTVTLIFLETPYGQ
jgi:hypothetical protein